MVPGFCFKNCLSFDDRVYTYAAIALRGVKYSLFNVRLINLAALNENTSLVYKNF